MSEKAGPRLFCPTLLQPRVVSRLYVLEVELRGFVLIDWKRESKGSLCGHKLTVKKVNERALGTYDLDHCHMSDAELAGANLKGAQLAGTNLTNTKLGGNRSPRHGPQRSLLFTQQAREITWSSNGCYSLGPCHGHVNKTPFGLNNFLLVTFCPCLAYSISQRHDPLDHARKKNGIELKAFHSMHGGHSHAFDGAVILLPRLERERLGSPIFKTSCIIMHELVCAQGLQ